MRILVDARELVRNKSGIGVVAKEIIERLHKDTENEYFYAVPDEKRLFSNKIIRLIDFFYWKSFHTFHLYKKNRCDLIFSLDPIPNLLTNNNIIIIHDLIFLAKPEWNNNNVWLKLWSFLIPRSIHKAKRIIVSSEATLSDIKRFFPKYQSNVTKIPFSISKDVPASSMSTLDKFDLKTNRYILFIGNAEPRRNLYLLLRAFSKSEYEDVKIAVVGNNTLYKEQINDYCEELGISNSIMLLGFVNEIEKADLFRNAMCHVCLSQYEGFGLTILESIKYHCPIICSNKTSLPEVAGETAFYVDIESDAELVRELNMVIHDNNYRLSRIGIFDRHFANFDWDHSVTKMIQLFSEIENETTKE